MIKERLLILFERYFGELPKIKALTGGGSPRQYFRLTSERNSVIGVFSEDRRDNEAFLRLDSLFEERGIKVPHIIIVSEEDPRFYLLEDLGDVSLLSLLSGPDRTTFAEKALKDLISIQTLPEHLWKDRVAFPPFSERLIRWDLNYFKYDFLKPYGITFDEERLEDDFNRLTTLLLDKEMKQGLMYRDFQSRNVMVKDGILYYIDFQGARKGPLAYDAVSFIWQAKAPFTFKEREDLCKFYSEELAAKLKSDPAKIISQIELMELFRTLQVLGAYGFRGLIERKAHFLESIPFAISNLNYLKGEGRISQFPEIERITDRLVAKISSKEKYEDGILTVKVISFSYKKGYPEDLSGNGGGFMFDCRAIHNPGRYEEYKRLTGKDQPVIEFLEKTDEAGEFVENALKIVGPSVDRYMKRGFTSLQVGFGCTGGQHRSVYCAERFAKEIKLLYPDINIEVIHREQGEI